MRLVIHAGFWKCGSSSIQAALAAKQRDLARRSIFLFGQDLAIQGGSSSADAPFWSVGQIFHDQARRRTVIDRLPQELARLRASSPDATAVLSTEVLGDPSFARLFAGIDEACETTLVFYMRPQHEWIPSAWKQWDLKSGVTLEDYVDDCLTRNAPNFLRSVDGWVATLPRAKVSVRILAQAVSESGSPAGDFFRVLGLEGESWRVENEKVNPSPDFALLHILNKNPWLFKSKEDREPFEALMRILPEERLATNIRMLRLEDEQRIADRFKADNRAILSKYCCLAGPDVEQAYETYFRPRGSERAYADVGEIEKINRGLGILLEIMLDRFGRKPILRPPYWKIPWRIVDRLRNGTR